MGPRIEDLGGQDFADEPPDFESVFPQLLLEAPARLLPTNSQVAQYRPTIRNKRQCGEIKGHIGTMKYIIVDFETNGRPCDRVLPKGGYPTQVSVEGFDPLTGEVTHLYDSFVRGALSLSQWVQDNTSVTLEKLKDAPAPCEVSQALADLWEEGDIVVAHNVGFDLDLVLPHIAGPTHPLLNAPAIDTMRERWAMQAFNKLPKLKELCARLEVHFEDSYAHDATYDAQALAKCMQAAHERGLTWTAKKRRPPKHYAWFV